MPPLRKMAVQKALETVDGVASAQADHEAGTAVVILSKKVDSEVLKKRLWRPRTYSHIN